MKIKRGGSATFCKDCSEDEDSEFDGHNLSSNALNFSVESFEVSTDKYSFKDGTTDILELDGFISVEDGVEALFLSLPFLPFSDDFPPLS